MKHWISLLTIANASIGDNSVKDLRRENAELKKALSNARSRSPRSAGKGKNRQQALPAQPRQLALPATTYNEQKGGKGGKGSGGNKNGGKGNKGGKGKKGKGKHDASVPANPSGFRSFDDIMSRSDANKHLFWKATQNQQVCFNFQSGRCSKPACPMVHVCIGCGVYGKPYNTCGCLEARIV